jgi:hypothetical protein
MFARWAVTGGCPYVSRHTLIARLGGKFGLLAVGADPHTRLLKVQPRGESPPAL